MRPNLAVALFAAALASSGGGSAVAQSALVQRGQAIAQRLCSTCHSIATDGESPLRLAPPLRTLPQRYPVDHLAEALAEGIVTGHPAMPQFKFSPTEIDALLTFIDSLAPSGSTKRK